MDTQEARIYLAIIATIAVLGVIIIYFTVSVIRQQKRNLELQKANALAEISAMERERARIAMDLHDELGPVLSVIRFQIDHVELVDAAEKSQLNRAGQSLDELIGKMRAVANNLMPSALQRKGLIPAVEEFISNANGTDGLAIRFTADEPVAVSEDKSINIYRVIQEVVHNCIKHAGASQLDIRFENKGTRLRIICEDNGKGFDYVRSAAANSGIGLRSLKNRTEIMSGTMTIHSKPGRGTLTSIEIPVS